MRRFSAFPKSSPAGGSGFALGAGCRREPLVLLLTAFLLAFAVVPQTTARAETTSGDTPPETIGTIRGDTLHVTLEQVTEAALTHNEMLAAAGAQADAARAEALGAWRGLLPQLHLGAFRIRSDDPLYSFGFKLNQRSVTEADFNPAYLNDPGTAENNIMQVKLLQPLFNGGMGIYGKRAANAASRAAAYQHVRAEETVRFQAAQAWHGLALAKTYEQVMLDAIAAATGHVRQAQALVDAEMATQADLLQARVHLSGLEQRLIEVRNLVAVAGENIKLLTAVTCELPLAPTRESVAAAVDLPSGDLLLTGIAGRSDLLARHHQVAAAGNMIGVARGAMLPHVNLSAEKNYFSENDLFGDDARSWTVGIYGTWNIFAGLGNVGGLKQARAARRAAEYMYAFELRQAKVEATQSWLEANAAREKVAVARDAVVAAREGLRIVTNQYREGLASMVDLLDTQAAATMAEGSLVQARHDYHVGLARLQYTGGPQRATEE